MQLFFYHIDKQPLCPNLACRTTKMRLPDQDSLTLGHSVDF
ncbi:hypothetical protein CHCC14821_0153 [Bacillus paralicheniformis]|nr:hypothetical protein CHCC14821_0153 [Bacillus paralicheniformis]TWM57021.1 hypothetical protein CHCC14814_4065 [Bacillus paralicheniformis]